MGTVIKRTGFSSNATAVPFHFDDLASGLGASPEPSSLIAQAHIDAEAIRRRAEEQGREAGLRTAERMLEEKVSHDVANVVSTLKTAVDRIEATKVEWLARWEHMAVRLAVAIAGRVIRREVEQTPDITLDLVREALELAAGADEIQLRLHPDDYQALGLQAQQIAAEISRLGKTQIISDSQVSKGGCKVETPRGCIDQQFETQLARIEQELS